MSTGRRERKKDHTRSALLAAATRLFAEQGIYSTTIEEITEAADLGKGTFYKHFESRDDIIAAVIGIGFSALVQALAKDIPKGASTSDLVRLLLERHAGFFRERPEYLLIFHQARGWLKLVGHQDSPIRARFQAYVRSLADVLRLSREGASTSASRRRGLALSMAGFVAGTLSFERIVGEPRRNATDLASRLHDLSMLVGRRNTEA